MTKSLHYKHYTQGSSKENCTHPPGSQGVCTAIWIANRIFYSVFAKRYYGASSALDEPRSRKESTIILWMNYIIICTTWFTYTILLAARTICRVVLFDLSYCGTRYNSTSLKEGYNFLTTHFDYKNTRKVRRKITRFAPISEIFGIFIHNCKKKCTAPFLISQLKVSFVLLTDYIYWRVQNKNIKDL